MSYYYGNANRPGGSAFSRGKGGKLLPARGNRAAQTAYRNRRSNERADRRSIAMGGGRGR
jgi:hypothetical protein